MITDKDGKEMSLAEVLSYLVGTDETDMAKSVIDFAVYTINEDKTVGDPQYYLVASEAIITNISFMGPFTMLEIDFRNVGIEILNQVMNVINKFHTDINHDSLLLLSTITSLENDATHIMSLANPLVCVRGFSEEGKSSTLVQMIFATDNVGFTVSDIDYAKIDADVEREIQELEATAVTKEAEEAAQEIYDENNEEMKDVFTPEFGLEQMLIEENVRLVESERHSVMKQIRSNPEKQLRLEVLMMQESRESEKPMRMAKTFRTIEYNVMSCPDFRAGCF